MKPIQTQLPVLEYRAESRFDCFPVVVKTLKWMFIWALGAGAVGLILRVARQSVEMSREQDMLRSAPVGGVDVYRDGATLSFGSKPAATRAMPAVDAVVPSELTFPQHQYGMVLASRMTSPTGREAIIVARTYRRSNGCIGHETSPALEVWIIEPSTWTSTRRMYPNNSYPFTLVRNTGEGTKTVRIGAATVDPNDKSLAKFAVTVGDDARTFQLQLRDGVTKFNVALVERK